MMMEQNKTFFNLMHELSRLSFLEEKYGNLLFRHSPYLNNLVENFTMRRDIDTDDYGMNIINGNDYGVDINIMIIRIPDYDRDIFMSLNFKSFWVNGKKTISYCIPKDISEIPLDEVMDLYFRYFASIANIANKTESNFENGTITCMVYTLLLKMIDVGIGIGEDGCSIDTIAKVLPASILTKNGLNHNSQLGNEYKIVERCINDIKFSEEFLQSVVSKLDSLNNNFNDLLDGSLSLVYAYELLAQSNHIIKDKLEDLRVKLNTLYDEANEINDIHDEAIMNEIEETYKESIDILDKVNKDTSTDDIVNAFNLARIGINKINILINNDKKSNGEAGENK